MKNGELFASYKWVNVKMIMYLQRFHLSKLRMIKMVKNDKSSLTLLD